MKTQVAFLFGVTFLQDIAVFWYGSKRFGFLGRKAVNMATIQQILYYSDFSSRIIDVAGSELALNQSSLSEFSGSLLDFLEILWALTVLAILYSAVCQEKLDLSVVNGDLSHSQKSRSLYLSKLFCSCEKHDVLSFYLHATGIIVSLYIPWQMLQVVGVIRLL